jgi:hypothetical protein
MFPALFQAGAGDTMTAAAELLAECQAGGIVLQAQPGGRLDVDAPARTLTPDLLARLRARKVELVEILRPAVAADSRGDGRYDPRSDAETTIRCPWCSSRRLLEGTDGLWCDDCQRLAWEPSDGGGLVRCDVAERPQDLPQDERDGAGLILYPSGARMRLAQSCAVRPV